MLSKFIIPFFNNEKQVPILFSILLKTTFFFEWVLDEI